MTSLPIQEYNTVKERLVLVVLKGQTDGEKCLFMAFGIMEQL